MRYSASYRGFKSLPLRHPSASVGRCLRCACDARLTHLQVRSPPVLRAPRPRPPATDEGRLSAAECPCLRCSRAARAHAPSSALAFRRSARLGRERLTGRFGTRPASCYDSWAVLGGELAVPCYLQSAPAGLNSLLRSSLSRSPLQVTLRAGSRAAAAREPCQVRKEAALSDVRRVPRKGLARAAF